MYVAYVYIITNKKNGTLYIGSTVDLVKRIWEHKQKITGGFSAKYGLNKLIYYEEHDGIINAGEQEKRYKNWRRAWKIALINQFNPLWVDLYEEICS
jgi:putative endonuclease